MIRYYNKGVVLEPQLEEWITSVNNSSSQIKSINTIYGTSDDSNLTSIPTILQTTPSITLLMTVVLLCLIIFLSRKQR